MAKVTQLDLVRGEHDGAVLEHLKKLVARLEEQGTEVEAFTLAVLDTSSCSHLAWDSRATDVTHLGLIEILRAARLEDDG